MHKTIVVLACALALLVEVAWSAEIDSVYVFTTPPEGLPSLLQWKPDGVTNEIALRPHTVYGTNGTKLFILHSVVTDAGLGSRLLIIDKASGQTQKSVDLAIPNNLARLSLTRGAADFLLISPNEKVYSMAWEGTGPVTANWMLMSIDSLSGRVQVIALPAHLRAGGFGPDRIVLPEGILFVRDDGTCVMFRFQSEQFSDLSCGLDLPLSETKGGLLHAAGFGLLRQGKEDGSLAVIGHTGLPAKKRVLVRRDVMHVQTNLRLGTDRVIAYACRPDGAGDTRIVLMGSDGSERWSKRFSMRLREFLASPDCSAMALVTEAGDQVLLFDRNSNQIIHRIDITALLGEPHYLAKKAAAFTRIVPTFKN